MSTTNAPATFTRRATLIGIRTYPQIPKERGGPLAGCHNDVAAMREALVGRGFEPAHIAVWVDAVDGCDCAFCRGELGVAGVPTRDGILRAVDALIDSVEPGDVAVLYFSGHGSELAGRGLYAGWRFQTLVSHDSGRGQAPNRDVLDVEIERWTRRLGAATPFSTLIFDCCHSGGAAALRGGSGGGTEPGTDSPAPTPRRIDADEREEAAGLETLENVERRRQGKASMRGEGASAIVLSASLAHELSSETSVDGRKQGLFTTQLTRRLREMKGESLRWSELFPAVAEAVTAENLSQHPRRQGDGPIFEPGELALDDVEPPDTIELEKLAVVIGVDYQSEQDDGDSQAKNRFPALSTPQRDAEAVARALEQVQGYEIVGISSKSAGPLLGKKATRRRIHKIIDRLISVRAKTKRETAVVIYFAGHGMVRTENGKQVGYLVPSGADAEEPSTWLPMQDLRDQLVDGIYDQQRLEAMGQRRGLARLTSRHLLLILDCCFGGALAFDFFRGESSRTRPIYYSEYRRFVEGTAWQLLSSASFNQQALDRDPADPDQVHSPFAEALIEALSSGAADSGDSAADHIVTASELHHFVDMRLKRITARTGAQAQTPGLTPLRPNEGQFIFHVPGFEPSPLPDPPLDEDDNPWPGADAYDGTERLFTGRDDATLELLDVFLDARRRGQASLAVSGVSGAGSSSLVRAGLLPFLLDPLPERERHRALLARQGCDELLIDTSDLEAVRAWIDELELAPLLRETHGTERRRSDERLSDTVATWAREKGLVHEQQALASAVSMQSLGIPSFSGSDDYDWLRRLGVLELIEEPPALGERLRLWHRRGRLADFFIASKREAKRLVGDWTVADGLDQLPAADGDEACQALLLDPLDREVLESPEWQQFRGSDDTLTIATTDASLQPEPADAWRLVEPRRPNRAALRRVIEEPAADRVLTFEPPEIIDLLLDQVDGTPAPLALLSLALAELYRRAWARRRRTGSDDRELRSADLYPGGLGGLLAERAEASFRALADDLARQGRRGERAVLRTGLRSLLWRAVELEAAAAACRWIPWDEIALFDAGADALLHERLLPALVRARVLVTARHGVRLSTPALLAAWPRLRRAVRVLVRSPQNRTVGEGAKAWKAADFSRGLLAPNAPNLGRLLQLRVLSRLERAFVVASELERRWQICTGLTHRVRDVEGRWASSALRIVAAARLTLRTVDERDALVGHLRHDDAFAAVDHGADRSIGECLAEVEQALHNVLATTSLSVALDAPELDGAAVSQLDGLEFDGGQLRARFGDRVFAWSLDQLEQPPDLVPESATPAAGAGRLEERKVGPRRISSGPFGPVALASNERAIRLFAPGQAKLPMGPFVKPPTPLLGHGAAPEFLLFDRQHRWLASAANTAEGPELRLWPLEKDWGPAAAPMTRYDTPLEQVPARRFEPAQPDLHRLGPQTSLPIELDEERQVVAVAEDLSHVELFDRRSGRRLHVDLPPQELAGQESAPPVAPFRRRPLLPRPGAARRGEQPAPWVELHLAGDKLSFFTGGGDGKLVSLLDGRTLFTTAPMAEDRAGAPIQDFEDLELAAVRLSPDGKCLAAAGIDGSIGLVRPERGGPPVLLPSGRSDGFAVRRLAFDRSGRRLAVEREAAYELGRLRLDLYHVDVEDLVRLARGHAGRELLASDLPAMLPVRLDDLGELERAGIEETKLYLAAIGAAGKS